MPLPLAPTSLEPLGAPFSQAQQSVPISSLLGAPHLPYGSHERNLAQLATLSSLEPNLAHPPPLVPETLGNQSILDEPKRKEARTRRGQLAGKALKCVADSEGPLLPNLGSPFAVSTVCRLQQSIAMTR